MIWGIFSLILLIIVIALVIWLLVRSDSCPKKAKLNDPCDSTTDCNSGLVCSAGSGSALTINNTNTTTAKTCKVASGEVCSTASECAFGQTCRNGICVTPLGTGGQSCPCEVGFTCISNVCRAIVGQPCAANTDCASGICNNGICSSTIGPTGPTGSTGCSSYYDSSCDTSCYTKDKSSYSKGSYDSSYTRDSGSSYTRDSGSRDDSRRHSYDSDSRRHSYDSDSRRHSYDSDSRRHSYDSSNSLTSSSYQPKHKYSSYDDSSYRSYSSDDKYVRRGVYVTNEQNQDQTLFTTIEQPIIDIVKTDKIYLLLKNGNIAVNTGINTTMYMTNKKMLNMVRFGNEIVGMDKKGKLYSSSKSNGNVWNWEHLKNFPSDIEFIDSTNTGTNLEVLTSRNKAYVYTYSTTWKDGKYISCRKTDDTRYYGKDLSRYIDIDERTNVGKTNDGQKVKHIKAAGFYPSNVLVPVLVEDSFTHNRIIDSKSYFLFEQKC